MNIAELFVRLRGDTSDLDRKLSASERQMLRLHGSTAKLEGGFRSAQFQTGRLGNQFASLAGQIAGVHPIVGNLAQVMGNFAIGGLVTVGVLAGVAAIALAYDALTGSARKAKKETDEFIKSLVNEAKAAYNASIAGRELALMRAEFELQEAQKGVGKLGLMGRVVGSMLGAPTGMDLFGDADEAAKRVADATTAVTQAQVNLGKTWEDLQPKAKQLKDTYMDLRDAIEKTRKAIDDEGKAWWANYSMKAAASEELTKSLTDLLAPNLNPNRPVGSLTDFGTNVSGVDPNIGLTKEQIKTRDALIGNADKNSQAIQSAIFQSSQIIASTISQALNIGGGGRGSSIFGAIGSIVGGAAGSLLGPAGAVITSALGSAAGSVIGGLAGSLFGGLFDSHKKEVNRNTQALRELTAAIYNSPSGYKVERGRFDATDVKEMGRAALRYSTRGGAPVLAGAR